MVTITTSNARCRDCYKCIRNCPVKAIGLKDGQAWVVEEKCIQCGICISVCPQNAKKSASQVNKFEQMLQSGEQVVVSLAPSYLAITAYSSPFKLVSALKELGAIVEETAIGAKLIAEEYHRLYEEGQQQTIISTCCPVVVNLVEKHFPDLTGCLAGLISPLQAHAKLIKQEYGPEVKVVFVGPCIGKKDECSSSESSVDAVITFVELAEHLELRRIDVESLPDVYPDKQAEQTRIYPIEGGALRASGIDNDEAGDAVSVTGVDHLIELFKDLQQGCNDLRFIEAMACAGGCVGGPEMLSDISVVRRSSRIAEAVKSSNKSAVKQLKDADIDLSRVHKVAEGIKEKPSEEQIREILAMTGKFTKADETNCGGCGYPSCRDKAIATFYGLAEPEMCIPYMRARAESLSNTVVETTPHAIIVADKNMMIQQFNPAAERMFNRRRIQSKGKHLSVFIDPTDFQTVWDTQDTLTDVCRSYDQYCLATRQSIYPIAKYGVVIGIITNVSEEQKQKAKLANMRKESLSRAAKVIEEQTRVAQEIAGLLGESTAETKVTLLELIKIMKDSGEL